MAKPRTQQNKGCGAEKKDDISSPMPRLLLLLLLLAFGVSNAVAAPLALCQHSSAGAHAAALESPDAATSASAHAEDAAAAASGKEGALAHVAATALGGMLLPGGPALPHVIDTAMLPWPTEASARIRSRTLAPLLDPPLA
jgi:hypothetical protein